MSTRHSNILWLMAIAICLSVWMATGITIYKSRCDVWYGSYPYLNKASSLYYNSWKTTPATATLKSQLSAKTQGWETNYQRSRVYYHVFNQYTPLSAVIIASLKALGVSWENSCWLMFFLLKIFAAISIALWTRTCWGKAASSICMILLSVISLPSFHLIFFKPSAFALCFALLLWWLIIAYPKRYFKSKSFILLLLPLNHPIGLLCAGASVLLHVVVQFGIRKKIVWKEILLFGLLLGIDVIILKILMQALRVPRPQDWTYWNSLKTEFIYAATLLFKICGTLLINTQNAIYVFMLFALSFLGFWHAIKKRNAPIRTIMIILISLLLLQIYYIEPGYKSIIFKRFLVPFFIFCIANFSFLIVHSAKTIYSDLKSKIFRPGNLLLFCVCLLMACVFINKQFNTSLSELRRTLTHNKFAYDYGQVDFLSQFQAPDNTIMYENQTDLCFFLTQGLWQNPTYAQYCMSPEDKIENFEIDYYVALNPYVRKNRKTQYGYGILLKPKQGLEIEFDTLQDLSNLRVKMALPKNTKIKNTADPIISLITENKNIHVNGIENFSRFIKPCDEPENISKLQIKTHKSPIVIEGLLIDTKSKLNWPWETKCKLSFTYGRHKKLIVSDPYESLSKAGLSGDVVADRGGSVIFKLKKGEISQSHP